MSGRDIGPGSNKTARVFPCPVFDGPGQFLQNGTGNVGGIIGQ